MLPKVIIDTYFCGQSICRNGRPTMIAIKLQQLDKIASETPLGEKREVILACGCKRHIIGTKAISAEADTQSPPARPLNRIPPGTPQIL